MIKFMKKRVFRIPKSLPDKILDIVIQALIFIAIILAFRLFLIYK